MSVRRCLVSVAGVLVVTVGVEKGYAQICGRILAWGFDDFGQVSGVPEGDDFIAIAAGGAHGVALKADGTVVAWGQPTDGQNQPPPGPNNNFIHINAGGYHNFAIRAIEPGEYELVKWGKNSFGELNVPEGVETFTIKGRAYHSVGITYDGRIEAWGRDLYDQLNAPAGDDFVKLSSRHNHQTSVAIKADGSLVHWGLLRTYEDPTKPYSLPPEGNDFVDVSCGSYHGIALRADGSLAPWCHPNKTAYGDYYGQYSATPTEADFTAVSCGGYHTVALRRDGSLHAWGRPDHGRCEVPEGNNFLAISSGGHYSMAIAMVPTSVNIDIKPGSDPNPINLGSNGVIPVAIFSTEDFNATTINPITVELAGAGVAVRGKGKSLAHVEDVNGDGRDDLVCQVETESLGDDLESGEVCLTGETFGGQLIEGCDVIVIVPPAE